MSETQSPNLKQGRLPFISLNPESKDQSGLKRKLSDFENKSTRASKSPKITKELKVRTPDKSHQLGEEEVSSSSEELQRKPKCEHKSPKGSIEKFFSSTREPVVTTTKSDDVINIDSDDEVLSSLKTQGSTSGDDEPLSIVQIKVVPKIAQASCAAADSTECNQENEVEGDKENLNTSQDIQESVTEKGTDTSSIPTPNFIHDAAKPCTDDKDPSGAKRKSQPSGRKSSSKKSAQKEQERLAREAQRVAEKAAKDAEKAAKEAEKQKKKDEKERERQEKLKQKEEAKLEKERQKLVEKEKREAVKLEKEKEAREKKEAREREREEKQRVKEEEKRKKEEEKLKVEEEKRKTEEEKKRQKEEQEQEQRERDERKKAAFQRFFIKKDGDTPTKKEATTSTSSLTFMPYEPRVDQRLPVQHRITDVAKSDLDEAISQQSSTSTLYIDEIKNGSRKPCSRGKTWPWTPDVEEVGSWNPLRAKLLQFHENYRPAYHGTWRKRSSKISPRNPLSQDTKQLDYEVDSDDEWEEEGEGENIDVSEGEEEKEEKEEPKDEDDDGFFVPDGYLSAGEGCDAEDEAPGLEKLRAHRVEKARSLENDHRRKQAAKRLKPVIISCTSEVSVYDQLVKYEMISLCELPISTCFTDVTPVASSPENEVEKPAANVTYIPVPKHALSDLIRLVHGNVMGIKRLSLEFRDYWRLKTARQNPTQDKDSLVQTDKTEPSDLPSQSVESKESNENNSRVNDVQASTDDAKSSICSKSNAVTKEAMDQSTPSLSVVEGEVISRRRLEAKILNIAVREKRPDFSKACWYVHDELLEQHSLKDLPVPAQWKYVRKFPPVNRKQLKTPEPTETASKLGSDEGEDTSSAKIKCDRPEPEKTRTPITSFLKPVPDKRKIESVVTSKEYDRKPDRADGEEDKSSQPMQCNTPTSSKQKRSANNILNFFSPKSAKRNTDESDAVVEADDDCMIID